MEAHGIATIDELRIPGRNDVSKSRLLECWQHILDNINYYPIFRIASDLLRPIPDGTANVVLNRLAQAASDLAGLGATTLHDLSGRMFQRLIADRKFLATFYTLPTSAALLGELAVARLDAETDWSDPDALTSLQVADLACGTGCSDFSGVSRSSGALSANWRRRSGTASADDGTRSHRLGYYASGNASYRVHAVQCSSRYALRLHPRSYPAPMDYRAKKSGIRWRWEHLI